MAFTSGQFPGFETAIHEPGIAVFTFNQPERMNGLTQAIKRELIEQLTQAQMDDAVRAAAAVIPLPAETTESREASGYADPPGG